MGSSPPAPVPCARFAGVDEAGLGPVLGPMTLGYSVFRGDGGVFEPWKALRPAVSRDPRSDRRAFVVADSKVVFQRTPRCSKRLEATALGFLALLDPARRPHTTLERYLWGSPGELAIDRATVAAHPWYRDAAAKPLPCHWEPEALELRVDSLRRATERGGIALVDAGVRVVPEGELNRSFSETDNKARTHWIQSRHLFRRIWDLHATEGVDLWVDRHGGRYHYGALLAQEFQDASVLLVEEAPELAIYSLTERAGGPRRMRVTFAERAEQRSFAVALASCLAKYARETAMDAFNAWFGARQPELEPTAGYHGDGTRWLADAEPTIRREAIDRAWLVRSR
jgi:ribonuclease HII